MAHRTLGRASSAVQFGSVNLFTFYVFFVSGWFDAGGPASTIYLREGPSYRIWR
jgi:hypothetical protein